MASSKFYPNSCDGLHIVISDTSPQKRAKAWMPCGDSQSFSAGLGDWSAWK